MPEYYISLEEAAVLEGMKYNTFVKRITRNPGGFKLDSQPCGNGGRPRITIAVSSLSPKAVRTYNAAIKTEQGKSSEYCNDSKENEIPWYISVDLNWYIENNKKQYYEAVELARNISGFICCTDEDKTALADDYAEMLNISRRTLYRHVKSIQEATAWALMLEQKDGKNHEYLKPLSLCRKPKDSGVFPSLTGEQKAVIENIWFDKVFASNLGTVEMLYEKFKEIADERGWESYPSIKTVSRYKNYLMDKRGVANAHYLAANGTREFKRVKMLKCKRDASALMVLEYVICDTHTFDLWVQYTHPNGKVTAVRPKLAGMMDMRSRIILGDVISVNVSSQTLKESLIKGIYGSPGGVMKALKIDNGRDYTAKTMTGQNRKDRVIEFDSETKGFYKSIGIEEVTRSLPYQAWDKPIERVFGTVCTKFSKWFDSYVGTLTASKTYAKRQKDVKQMLERGELLTMEEFFECWTKWKNEKYHKNIHRGLVEENEKWHTPIEVYENAPRYEKAAPPREYAAMLLLKADTARVRSQGIYKFGILYTAYELCHYEGQTVGVKWDVDDITRLYVYDGNGKRICEATTAELMQFGGRVSQAALEELKRSQNRQLRETRELLETLSAPYERRIDGGRLTEAVGKLDITIKADRPQKAVYLPNDKEFRHEYKNRDKSKARAEFFGQRAEHALARLRAINE